MLIKISNIQIQFHFPPEFIDVLDFFCYIAKYHKQWLKKTYIYYLTFSYTWKSLAESLETTILAISYAFFLSETLGPLKDLCGF
jgi:hypothetical protein